MEGGGGGGAEGCALNEILNRSKPPACGFLRRELPNQGPALPGYYPFLANPFYPFLPNLTRYPPDLSLPVVKPKWVLYGQGQFG
jgi:hypothetical protein